MSTTITTNGNTSARASQNTMLPRAEMLKPVTSGLKHKLILAKLAKLTEGDSVSFQPGTGGNKIMKVKKITQHPLGPNYPRILVGTSHGKPCQTLENRVTSVIAKSTDEYDDLKDVRTYDYH